MSDIPKERRKKERKRSMSMTNLVSWASYKQLIPRYKFDTSNLQHQLSPINKAIYVNQDTHTHINTQQNKAADPNMVRTRVWGRWYRKTQVNWQKNKTFLVWPVSVDKICPDNRSKRTAFVSTPPVAMTSCWSTRNIQKCVEPKVKLKSTTCNKSKIRKLQKCCSYTKR